MEDNEIEPLWIYLWNETWNVANTKKFYEL